MKRYGAGNNTDVRKRMETEVARPFAPLTDEEIEDIRRAYLDGCKGEVIIGLRGDERVITMLLPEQPDLRRHKEVPERMLQVLRAIGCDRCQKVNASIVSVKQHNYI